MTDKGMVYLVGAGPGHPKLLTLRGAECLGLADVVIYDYLAHPSLLRHARDGAELIYVGKEAGAHTLKQEEINDLIVRKAEEGNVVARLKGGDPFVFGRGGEEAEALASASISFEMIPGITSPIAAPAFAGIPVTHRGLSSAFAVITGHEDPTKADSDIDWAKISTGIGTLIFVMGMRNLKRIASQLMHNGRSPDTPVAIVRWGTTPRQEALVGTLANIVERVEQKGLKPPAVIVVGDVVAMREKLRWFDAENQRPLLGRRILVTRTREQASALVGKLADLGAEVIEVPVVQTVALEDLSLLDEAIRRIPEYDWLVFTSANGVGAFLDRLEALGQDMRSLAGLKICAVGPATGAKIASFHVQADCIPETYIAEAIPNALGDIQGKRILLPQADLAREDLVRLLFDRGADVDSVVAYRTVPVDNIEESSRRLLEAGPVDMVTFTSSSTVRNFVSMVDVSNLEGILESAAITCIGPITAKTASDLGLTVHCVAEKHTIDGLIDVILQQLTNKGAT